MSLPTESKTWIIQNPPTHAVNLDTCSPGSTFVMQVLPLKEIENDEALVQPIFFSNDPGQRGNMQRDQVSDRPYFVPFARKGDAPIAFAICRVLASRIDGLEPGSLIDATVGWREYAIVKAGCYKPVCPTKGLSANHYLSVLGLSGITIYFGLNDVLQLKEGQTLVVSAAAGATGSLAVQYAKKVIKAGKVIAICGSDEKCAWVREIGADIALNYKDPQFPQQLKDATPKFVDAYYDNVGGNILDLVMGRMKPRGRIAATGSVSIYNNPGQTFLTNWMDIIVFRITIIGFVVLQYVERFDEAVEALTEAVEQGKIDIRAVETVVRAPFEDIPCVWGKMWAGENKGKLVTQVADL